MAEPAVAARLSVVSGAGASGNETEGQSVTGHAVVNTKHGRTQPFFRRFRDGMAL